MASDPNFALRTHERLFTGRNKNQDLDLRKAAWAAVPKCAECGRAVMFKGGRATHYNSSLDGDLSPMEKASMDTDALSMDSHHVAKAEIPADNGAPTLPARTAGAAVVAKPDASTAAARGVETRARNRAAANRRSNALLGRQWDPLGYDENGIALSAVERQKGRE